MIRIGPRFNKRVNDRDTIPSSCAGRNSRAVSRAGSARGDGGRREGETDRESSSPPPVAGATILEQFATVNVSKHVQFVPSSLHTP